MARVRDISLCNQLLNVSATPKYAFQHLPADGHKKGAKIHPFLNYIITSYLRRNKNITPLQRSTLKILLQHFSNNMLIIVLHGRIDIPVASIQRRFQRQFQLFGTVGLKIEINS